MSSENWNRLLGKTNISVSPLGLGTVKFGRNQSVKYPEGFDIPDMQALSNLLDTAKSCGINTLDTAPAYGESEQRLGELLKGQRKNWVIVGKAGEEFKDGKSHYDFTPDHFERSLEQSLKRLNTDYIDIFLIHSDGRDIDILANDELVQRLYGFKDQGLVKALGASTKTVSGGIITCEVFDTVMATYNLGYDDEKPVLDYAAKHGAGVLVKKAFGSGHLISGSKEAVQASMDYVFTHPGVTSVITGTINPDHLKENADAVKKALKQRV